ncbi:MAG: hypothetical protein O7C61_09850 [SAR324 cluster bacterium]|nr:hypothetical protein [SAR324 cluster bacterium]
MAAKSGSLLVFHEVEVSHAGQVVMGPVDWTIHRSERIWLECGNTNQYEGFVELISGRRKPSAGYIEELGGVTVQSDRWIRESINLNQSIQDYLHSTDAPEFVWMENRRRSINVLLDRIGLTPDKFRRPLKLQPGEVLDKFWVVRFLVSKADLLIGRDIFMLADPLVRGALRVRWSDIPGAVIAAGEYAGLPGTPDVHVRVTGDGAFSSRPYS